GPGHVASGLAQPRGHVGALLGVLAVEVLGDADAGGDLHASVEDGGVQAPGPGVGGDHGPARIVPGLAVAGGTQEDRPAGVLAAGDPDHVAAAQLPQCGAGRVAAGTLAALL